jgi:3-phosphoshikimate 1-carboxyvinyltransferase
VGDADVRLAEFELPVGSLPARLDIPTIASVRPGEDPAFDIDVCPPGSKSLTNRALLLAALGTGESRLNRPLVDADDARQMLRALRTLGAGVDESEPGVVRITGTGGEWKPTGESEVVLHLENAGTAVRFLAAGVMLSRAGVVIDGNARMRMRPIGELGELLEKLGAKVEYLGTHGCPPLRITPPVGGVCTKSLEVGATQSSQFVSALLLVAPFFEHGLTLRLREGATSASYVAMTAGLLSRLGVDVQTSADQRVIRVHPAPRDAQTGRPALPGFTYDVEPDASGATYFWAAAAMVPGARARVLDLDDNSLQGDSDFAVLLRRMGARAIERRTPESSIRVVGPAVLEPIMADMSDMPDAAMSLAAAACFARGTSVMRGLKTLRVKETDRIEALRSELTKVGVRVDVGAAGDPATLTITPPPGGIDCSAGASPVAFETYDDHRMAMSLSLIGLLRPNVAILNPACVAKTYPGYWADFAKMYARPAGALDS